jgi:uncharacterized RDD family membrane protein YckC
MEDRNPYAAPRVPVIAADEPTQLPGDPEHFEYGAFWRRVGALLLDTLILAPLGIAAFVLLNYTKNAYLYLAVPSFVISTAYYIWLVKRFGGTPGKLITRMRITMSDGSPVTLRAAFLRYSPLLVLHVISLVAMIQTSVALDDGFESLDFMGKMQALQRNAPGWNGIVTWLGYAWWIATAVTLVANRRKRAAHDFLAGTVVLRID